MVRLFLLFSFFCLSSNNALSGISEDWRDFKKEIIKSYLPTSQKELNSIWKDSVEHYRIHSSDSTYIQKTGGNRIASHYFLSRTIRNKNLIGINIAEKKVILINDQYEPLSLEDSKVYLSDEAFLQRNFLDTVEFYAKEKLPEAERVEDKESNDHRVFLRVLAKRVSFSAPDVNFGITQWNNLRDLVLETPFDLGYSMSNYNFGLTLNNDIIIFDTEEGAFQDGKTGMYNFALGYPWVEGQEKLVEIANNDVRKWRNESTQKEKEVKNKESREKEEKIQEKKKEREERIRKALATKNIFEEPKTSTNILMDLIDYIETGDCVALVSNSGIQTYYLKGRTQDPSQIRFVVVDVRGTNLALDEEWPWYIKDHFRLNPNQLDSDLVPGPFIDYIQAASKSDKIKNVFFFSLPF